MSFSFNKETRRSLRERIRDGINLIPGASTVVQAPANILGANNLPPAIAPTTIGGNGKTSGGSGPGSSSSSSSSPLHYQHHYHHQQQKKSHSIDSTPTMMINEDESSIKVPPPPSPSYLTADNPAADDSNRGSRSGSVSSCSSSTSSSPSKYRTYVVKEQDTVTSIAASFDCTPSELMRVNRLITARVLFPGQVLKIPNKKSGPATPNASTSSDNAGGAEPCRPPSVDPATANIIESITYAQRKFLKIKVRHVTDGNGVVSGTLLITPNAVMFDPNVSDPLVIEQGAETYGIIVPIEYIVGASIWSDICGMKVRGKVDFIAPGPRPVLWGNGNNESERCSTSSSSSGGNGSGGGPPPADENATDKSEGKSAAPRLEEVTDHPLKDQPGDHKHLVTTWYFCLTIGRPKGASERSPSTGDGADGNAASAAAAAGRRARRTPFCVTYGQKNSVRPEFWFSVAKEQVPELYKYWMFWWPNIYGELDLKLIEDRGYELVDWDNLDVVEDGQSQRGSGGAAGAAGAAGGKARNSNGDNETEEQSMAQELNELTKESWEMLKQPYAKLSSFITTRGSSIMKSSSHSSQSSVSDSNVLQSVGGVPCGSGPSHQLSHPPQQHHASSHGHASSSSTSLFNSHHFSITNPMNSFFFESFSNISPNHSVFDDTDDDDDEFGSFEQVVTNEELRNLLAMGGEEMMAINLPDLIGGKSDILQEEDMRNITRHLTARAEGYPWTLIFTSSRDGFSLNSLYRRNSLMQEDSPVILIIQDTNSRVFGALVSCSLHTSDSFYGTGQSFLFTLRPEFNVYKWTGENLFFVKGNHDGIWIGAGDGKFGLYIDGDLNCGRTEQCQTYGNIPLTEPQDFIIKTLECWAFGNYVLTTGNDLISGSDK